MIDNDTLETLTIPERLLDAIQCINNNILSSMSEEKLIAWVSIRGYLWDNITHEESLGNISPGQKVLELGSGSGDSILTWSYKGYPVTGIELNKELFIKSKELLEEYSDMQNAPITLFNGSYYPKEYLKSRKTNEQILRIEKEYKDYLYAHKASNVEHLRHRFKPVCDVDIYATKNIDMKEFDIWYAYLWTYQVPSVLDMFKKYARDDAKILMIAKWGIDIASDIGLETQRGSNIMRKRAYEY